MNTSAPVLAPIGTSFSQRDTAGVVAHVPAERYRCAGPQSAFAGGVTTSGETTLSPAAGAVTVKVTLAAVVIPPAVRSQARTVCLPGGADVSNDQVRLPSRAGRRFTGAAPMA